MALEINVKYRPARTASIFHNSDKELRSLIGPIGCGKSVACCAEIGMRASRQQANKNGVRLTKWAVIRNTEPQLWQTTIATWKYWWPDPIGTVTTSPYPHAWLRFPLKDGTRVEAEVIFLSYENPNDSRKLLSLDLTGIWINEAKEMSMSAITDGLGRLKRYPPKEEVPLTWSGIFMDSNPPNRDHWLYDMTEIRKYKDSDFANDALFLKYDPPMITNRDNELIANPEADYVKFQQAGIDYWHGLIKKNPKDWVKVYVFGQYGFVQDGLPMFPDFDEECHVAKEVIPPNPYAPLIIGHDYGRTPACAIMQYLQGDQLVVIDEIVTKDTSVKDYVEFILKPQLFAKYSKFWQSGQITSVGDPSGNFRTGADSTTFHDVLERNGLPTLSHPMSNQLLKRNEAVVHFMLPKSKENSRFIVSPNCTTIVAGLRGEYRKERVKAAGVERYKDKPVKNMFSHVCEAMCYGAFWALHPQLFRTKMIQGTSQNKGGWA